MPDRHRHDEFILALIFSMIINFLIVFVFVAQLIGKDSTRFSPFVVTLEASRTALPRESLTIVRAIAVTKPVGTAIKRESRPSFATQARVELVLPPSENAEVAVSSPVMPTDLEGKGSDSPLLTPEAATTAPAEETADGTTLTGGNHTAPQRISGDDPPYPQWEERRGWEGRVLLSLLINSNGEVERVGIVESSGAELLDHQVRASVATWRFKPAQRNGLAIAATVQQEIIFRRTFSGNNQ